MGERIREVGETRRDSAVPRGSRRRARILALQTLFEADLVGHDPLEILARDAGESGASPVVSAYARQLVEGVVANQNQIDRILSQAAPAWPLEQMPAIDKNLLRVAIYEVLFDNKRVPVKVAINEAVEIAKTFGSESTSRFVNGVLGTVVAGQESQS